MRRVCVFYSKGRSYLDALRRVRAEYADASVVAMTPPNYMLSAEETAEANAVAVTGRASYSARLPVAFARLVREIRANRFDLFVITFDSTRLRILASLSGAGDCAYCSMDGRIVPIKPTLAGSVATAAAKYLCGRLVYAWVWTVVRVAKVKNGKQTR